ncbi:hypothetical protein TSUD_379110 [Trifolium subterraneum]|uniref:Uncharacterized protein n=2 Tax=Trifolium TaxID=3898 RepID=A0A2Z6P7M2_TRISU|nr:hypothetical protein TSUD_379110 [Trifolium subterraneum]
MFSVAIENRITDTTAAEARKGKDIQGIPWDRLSISREKYRQTRLEQYKNYENIARSGELSEKECKVTQKGGLYYDFWQNTRSVKSTILHFQLRNLVWSTSKHDVYLVVHYSIVHWSSLCSKRSEVLNVSGHVAPCEHTSLSPNGKLLAIVGDNPDGLLVDSQTGKTIAPLCGHLDYSFASAWHPDGFIFATGNQDKTCRIWDARNLSKSVAVLKGNLGAIRSIRFTSDGRYMAMAEPADFVHVYDAKQGFEKEQQIDFFGEVSGVSFSPDTESLFIGVWDRTYGSLLQFNRRRNYMYLDYL